METITINKITYTILNRENDKFLCGEETYEFIQTQVTREKEFIAFLEIINGKFYFLKRLLVRERLYLDRFKELDNNKVRWGKWIESWIIEEVL